MRGNITVVKAGVDDAARAADKNNKKAISKNCAPFTDCLIETNDTKVDNAEDLEVVMHMYNVIEYSDNYQKHLEVYKRWAK